MSYIKSEYKDLDRYDDYEVIFYYKKGTRIYHNPYGPSYITKSGYVEYWVEGIYHRLDGPAIIYSDGEEEYYINGEYLSKEEFEVHPERLKFLGKEYLLCLI